MERRITISLSVFALSLLAALTIAVAETSKPTNLAASLIAGKVQLKSAGALTFGPDGVLFVGDSVGSTIAEIDTNDHKASQAAGKIDVEGIDAKIAALVGMSPDQIMINDVKVNPISKNVYLSASRGKGPEASALILRVDGAGELTSLPLDNMKHASVSITDAPASNPSVRQDPRMMTITDMAYVNGTLMVAGLSNEEWSSALRSIPVPFKTASEGATLQIWHSSHGRYETASPVRSFVPYTISGQPFILAAYTCTPLVKIPVSELKPGSKVKGVTIADLGSGNQPLDMVPYKKDGHNYILIANTSLGLVKLNADGLEGYSAIDSPTVVKGAAGVPYDKISEVKNVRQLARLDETRALVLTGKPGDGSMNLQTIALP
jgi:hypothetical protein